MKLDSGEPQYHSRALDRGLVILECLAASTSGSESLAELHALTKLPKSTLLRLLVVLERRGFVRTLSTRSRYRLGHAVVGLSESYRRNADLTEAATPFLDRLVRDSHQTANLGVLDGSSVLHLLVLEPERSLRFRSASGSRDAVHCTGLGKMLLAGLPQDEARALLESAAPLETRTGNTITNIDALMDEIGRTRARDFAVDSEESARGVCCLAVPVRRPSGPSDSWLASISVSGPIGEMSGSERDRLLRSLSRIAEQMGASSEFSTAIRFSPWGSQED